MFTPPRAKDENGWNQSNKGSCTPLSPALASFSASWWCFFIEGTGVHMIGSVFALSELKDNFTLERIWTNQKKKILVARNDTTSPIYTMGIKECFTSSHNCPAHRHCHSFPAYSPTALASWPNQITSTYCTVALINLLVGSSPSGLIISYSTYSLCIIIYHNIKCFAYFHVDYIRNKVSKSTH